MKTLKKRKEKQVWECTAGHINLCMKNLKFLISVPTLSQTYPVGNRREPLAAEKKE